jgi:hypothetical protein
LEWIYEEAESGISPEASSFKLPPLHDLDKFYECALKGDLINIQHQADALKRTSPEFASFADRIIQFAQSYLDMGLLDFIEAAMEEQKNRG